jgi:hypothetical protein
MPLLNFMGEHPVLTFFLALIVAGLLHALFAALKRK